MQQALDITVSDFQACLTLVEAERERKRKLMAELEPEAQREAKRLARKKHNLDMNQPQEAINEAEREDRRLSKLENRLRAAITAFELVGGR